MSNDLRIHAADATELTLEVAGLGSRSYAFIIDWHIRALFAVLWLLVVWLVMARGSGFEFFAQLFEDHGASSGYRVYFAFLPALGIYLLYHPVLEIAMQGRTPGKRMAGVRLVEANGQPAGLASLLIRNVFRLVDALPTFYAVGCIACLLSGRSVRIGDLAAGTLLVHEENPSPRALERAQRLAANRPLTASDQEILFDLMDRWKMLDRNIRSHLAVRFLEKLGEGIPHAADNRRLGEALYAKLQQIAGESQH
jgi:uncharacterized RDD family membrane protein YckC